jgi:hypothetical protein
MVLDESRDTDTREAGKKRGHERGDDSDPRPLFPCRRLAHANLLGRRISTRES